MERGSCGVLEFFFGIGMCKMKKRNETKEEDDNLV
jgi:hypothetical protein